MTSSSLCLLLAVLLVPSGFLAPSFLAAATTAVGDNRPRSRTLVLKGTPVAQPQRRTVLVTGALGCIGPGVVQHLLDAGFDVTVLDTSPEVGVLGPCAGRVRFVQADIRDRATLRAVMPSVVGVVNLAAMSRVSWCALWPRQCMDVNVGGTQAVVDVILQQRPRPWLLQASSREVFGGVTQMPVNESTPQRALNVYGQSKVETEQVVRRAVAEGGLVAIIFRFSNVYGSPMDHVDRVIPGFVAAALSHQPLAVSGKKLVDFTHVDDTARAVVLATRKLEGWVASGSSGLCEDFNIASGQSSDLRTVAEQTIRLAGSSSSIAGMRSDPMFVDAYSTRLDKVATQLSFSAKVRIEDGLQRYIALMRAGKTFAGQNTSGFQAGLGQSRMLRLYDVPLDVHKLTPKPLKIVILGAGVCGICAAIRLLELGHHDFELLEASDRLGGLASSYRDDKGFTWDIGVHVLSSHYQFFDVLLDNRVPPQEWGHHVRGVKAYVKGRYIDYSVQNNQPMLPEQDVVRCLKGLLDATLARKQTTARLSTNSSDPYPDFRDWALHNFEKGLTETFLLTNSFKVSGAVPAMNHRRAGEQAAKVNVKVVKNAVLRRSQPHWGPDDATFRYPLNGTGQIWESVGRAIPPPKLRLNSVVEGIGPNGVTLAGGAKVTFDRLLTTLPMDRMLDMLSPELRPTGISNGTFVPEAVHVVGLGFRGALPDHLQGVHWLYFPEPEIPFYRVTMLSAFSPRLVPGPGYYSILAEISESKYRVVDEGSIVDATLQACRAINLTSPTTQVASMWHKRMEYGHPVPHPHRDREVHTADEQLRASGIWSRGRFGGWKYEVSNQDHVCMQGVEAVDNMLLGLKELTFFQPDVVNGMHRPYPPHPLVPAQFRQLSTLEIIISPCGEAMGWLTHVLKHSLPPDLKYVVHVYERCPSPKSPLWDALHHAQRVPFPPGPPITAILHHLSHSTVMDTSTALVFLSPQQSNPANLANQLAEVLRQDQGGFHFLGGSPVTVEPTPAQCELYCRLMEGKCPKSYRSRSGSQFLVARRRVGLVARYVWRDALQMVRDRPAVAVDLLDSLWPLLFGEAPTPGASPG